MPKNPNAKKLASQEWSKIKTLKAATQEKKYIVAKVEKSLGFCQFQCQAETPQGGLQSVTALIRGKMKGGRNCPTRVEVGCYVLVEGDMTKLMEIVGVVNRQEEFNRLKRAGRVSRALMEGDADEDDLFDRSEASSDEGDIWAKRSEEAEAKAAHLVRRYRRAEEGVKQREANCLRASEDVEAAELDAEEEEFNLWAEAEKSPIKPMKKMGRRAAAAAAAAAEAEKAALEFHRQWLAEAAAEAAAERALEELVSRPIPSNWEDEIDIDAI
jgi:hypothetical protein